MNFKEELFKILNEIFTNDFAYSSMRIAYIRKWGEHIPQFMELFYRLEDDHSKKIFFDLLKYNIAAAMIKDYDKYSLYPKGQWDSLVEKANNIKYIKDDYILDRIETFILEGYNYREICCAQKDDYVIDCGAYTGNTAVYFSNRVGEKGKVFAFEAMPTTYAKLKENIIKTKKEKIYTYNYAVSDQRKTLSFTKTATPGSRQIATGKGIDVQAISIDEFVHENNIKNVSFIKMDVEGAELDVLNGCKETCKKFSPILAVCLYHKTDDFITLPALILQIEPNYRFYLNHNSNTFNETVLFAIKKETPLQVSIDEEELQEVKSLWSLFEKIHNNKERLFKKLLLSSYVETFTNTSSFKLQWKTDPKNFNFAFSPLSKDEKLHFEFLFKANSIQVSLHLEKDWISYAHILKEILDVNKISGIKLQHNSSSFSEGCYFDIKNIHDIDYITKIMNYLISISLPILKKHSILSDKIILDNPTI